MARNNRPDSSYEIGGATKAIKVLEALEGRPVRIDTLMERTGFNYDMTTRCLKTLRLNGWVTQLETGEWTVGRRFVRFAGSITRAAGVLT